MTIYLDYLFIENVILDYIILNEVATISKCECKKKKMLIASIVSSLYIVLMLLFKLKELSYFISKIILVFVTVYLAFKPNRIISYVKLVFMFLLVSVVNVGILVVTKSLLGINEVTGINKISIYIFVYLTGRLLLFKLWKIYSTNVTKASLNYKVALRLGNNRYTYDAFLDTGNTVYSHGMPIIFAELLDEDIYKYLQNREFFDVKTVTLGSVCKKEAYIFDDIEISNNQGYWRVKAGVVFEKGRMSKLNNYNMILNYILYTDSLGGIKI